MPREVMQQIQERGMLIVYGNASGRRRRNEFRQVRLGPLRGRASFTVCSRLQEIWARDLRQDIGSYWSKIIPCSEKG
jgi:hypothetical protein